MKLTDLMRAWLNRSVTWRGRVTRRLRTAWRPHVLFLTGLADGHAGGGGHEPGVSAGNMADMGFGVGVGMHGGDAQAALVAFGRWCAEHEGAVCELALSSRWLLCSAHAPGVGGASIYDEATRQWAHYHDLDATVLSADWTYREVARADLALAVAAPRALIEGLATLAKAHGVRITSVRPWWVRAVQTCLSMQDEETQSSVLRLTEPGLVTHVRTDPAQTAEGRVQAIWAEAAMPGRQSAQADGFELKLPEPAPSGEADGPGTQPTAVWSHRAMHAVLMGEESAWQRLA